jgi:L-methionine (R)-S-oxide reductase
MSQEKAERYERSQTQIRGLLEELSDPVAAMASVAAVLYENLPWASWVGFYRVVAPKLLRIGPYQGPVGCLHIVLATGVCGVPASTHQTQLVADVHAFAGHIACDPQSRSELVVPVLNSQGGLVAILDLDSREPSAFDETDARHLEQIAAMMAGVFEPPSSL